MLELVSGRSAQLTDGAKAVSRTAKTAARAYFPRRRIGISLTAWELPCPSVLVTFLEPFRLEPSFRRASSIPLIGRETHDRSRNREGDWPRAAARIRSHETSIHSLF